ncbi:hypothetical protein I6A60_01940 [Frankia sp. AgB1.9]|uniref:hypothetical protein n=1 Tax=unclassified Frankia TaxID=2632575 RepID=UPI00193396A5|nr:MULTISPECIES: hypothetical protein [unclassified Frankia]MBL7492520.1 hypothetical protein [Frankia sp. AgW1.1]MBL7546647.1 hypothetical protein [Frankia sp. AgB1.9]MBL7624683.1 hypothetical protein [Frankia sp. AgB1.8]
MPLLLINTRLFTGGADLTGASNKIEISAEVEDKDVTTHGSGGWKEHQGGLADTELGAEGFWAAGDPGKVDDQTWAALGGVGAWTVGPDDAAVGNLAYLTRALRAQYQMTGSVGDVAGWNAGGKGSWPLARGVFAHPPGTARTASGTGTGINLGAVAAGKRLYASLHVLSVAGTTPTLDVVVESDADNTFASPISQVTFTQAVDRGGQIGRTSAAGIADSWVRAKWTVGGTSPSFLFVVAVGTA